MLDLWSFKAYQTPCQTCWRWQLALTRCRSSWVWKHCWSKATKWIWLCIQSNWLKPSSKYTHPFPSTQKIATLDQLVLYSVMLSFHPSILCEVQDKWWKTLPVGICENEVYMLVIRMSTHPYIMWSKQCFFLIQNWWSRWVSNHPKEGVAKFGYRLGRKIEKFSNPATCRQHARTYWLNMVTWAHFFLIMWQQWPIFPKKNHVYHLQPLFFLSQRFEILPKNNYLI
jgi:hypothetical protein